VGRYVAVEAATSPLHHTTFEALIERLNEGEAFAEKLRELTPAEHARLVQALTDLCEQAQPELQPESPAAALKSLRPRHVNHTILSSVQAERMLTDAIAALRDSPRFPSIRFAKLGEFWQDDWARAPFEEALTLQQMVDMKVAALLEKRSLSHAKILHVVGALEHASGKSPGVSAPTPNGETGPVAEPPVGAIRAPETPRHTWTHADLADLPPTATASLKYIQTLGAELTRHRSPLEAVVGQIPSTLSAAEAAVAWFRIDSPHDVVASLLRLPLDEVAGLTESARNKLGTLFSQVAPLERQSFDIALRHAAMPLEPLIHTIGGGNVDHADLCAVLRLLVTTLGAVHPVVHGRTLHRYYTLAPQAAEMIIDNVVVRLPRSDEAVRRELALLLPFVPESEATALLGTRARLDTDVKEWRVTESIDAETR